MGQVDMDPKGFMKDGTVVPKTPMGWQPNSMDARAQAWSAWNSPSPPLAPLSAASTEKHMWNLIGCSYRPWFTEAILLQLFLECDQKWPLWFNAHWSGTTCFTGKQLWTLVEYDLFKLKSNNVNRKASLLDPKQGKNKNNYLYLYLLNVKYLKMILIHRYMVYDDIYI